MGQMIKIGVKWFKWWSIDLNGGQLIRLGVKWSK